jgi:hypothetical protein
MANSKRDIKKPFIKHQLAIHRIIISESVIKIYKTKKLMDCEIIQMENHLLAAQ